MKKKTTNTPTIALVYDKLNTQYGGAEHVLKALLDLFPHAPLFTSIHLPENTPWIGSHRVKTTWLNAIPILKYHFTYCAPLLPLAFESLDLQTYDIVISITSGEAKGILTHPNQLHVCYLLTPPRYLYSHKQEYKKNLYSANLPIFSSVYDQVRKYQTWWDAVAAYRPDIIIPISNKVAHRVKKYYGLETKKVLYPPLPPQPPVLYQYSWTHFPYLLITSRLVAYKRLDLVILASLNLKKKLVVVGDGPEKKRLIELVPDQELEKVHPSKSVHEIMERFSSSAAHVLFLNTRSEQDIYQLLSQCHAFVLPGVEDFGIAPLQAASYGKPVIIHKESGVAEILPHRLCGVHLKKSTVEEVEYAIKHIYSMSFDNRHIRATTLQYQVPAFQTRFAQQIQSYYQ